VIIQKKKNALHHNQQSRERIKLDYAEDYYNPLTGGIDACKLFERDMNSHSNLEMLDKIKKEENDNKPKKQTDYEIMNGFRKDQKLLNQFERDEKKY
jgi:hypothetical protein